MTNLTHSEVLALLSAAQLKESDTVLNLISAYKARSTAKVRFGLPDRILLEQSIRFGHIDIVLFCLDAYEDILNTRLFNGRTPVIAWAACCKQLEIVQLLIDRQVNVHRPIYAPGRSIHNKTALEIAIENQQTSIAKCILNASATLPDSLSNTILHDIEDPELITLVLQRDSKYLNAKDEYERTPLIMAARRACLAKVQILIQHKADLNQRINAPAYCDDQHTALESAIRHNQVDIVDLLITTPSVIMDKQRLLCIASSQSNHDMMTFILNHCIECLNEGSANNQLILYVPKHKNPVEIKREWISSDANSTIWEQTACDRPGRQALHYAIEADNVDAARLLIAAGAIYRPLDERFPKPVQFAAHLGNTEILRFLLAETPSDLSCRNAQEQTLLYLAAETGRIDTVAHLVEQQVDIQQADIQIASDNGHYQVVNILILKQLDEVERLSWIKSSEQAFDFIRCCPEKSPLLFNDARIKCLLENAARRKDEYLSYYEPSPPTKRQRSESFYVQIHQTTGTAHVYTETQALSHGTYGNTRVFSSPDRDDIVVKANQDGKNIKEQEGLFIKKAYPDSQSGDFFNFTITHSSDRQEQRIQRLILPFFKGKALSSYKKLDDPGQLFLIMIGLTRALSSIHQKGIRHGDVATRNIIVEELEGRVNISYIDFGLSATIFHSLDTFNDYRDFNDMIAELIYKNPVTGYQLILNYSSIQRFFERYPDHSATAFNQFSHDLLSDYHQLLINHQQALTRYAQSLPDGTAAGVAPTLFS